MPTLLLRLCGAMQSWGTQSRFTNRDTGREPSKSGVIGLVCAALGVDREDDAALQPLAALTMGVRVDREGKVARDYHTAGGGTLLGGRHYGVYKANASKGDPVISDRFYLSDAEFIVGLEGADRALLERCHEGLRRPHWPLALGRKSFPPGLPVCLPDGLVDQPLESALRSYPWRVTKRWKQPDQDLRLVLESAAPTSMTRFDQPVSFRQEARQFGDAFRLRYVSMTSLPADDVPLGGDERCLTSHA